MDGANDPHYLKVKDAGEAIAHAREQLDAAGTHYKEQHIAFFEKLALLNGGALASSATVLGYFAPSHGVARASSVIEAAWGMLAVGMVASFSRNYFAPLLPWYQSFEIYMRKKAEHQRADADAMRNLRDTILDRYSGQPLDRDEEIRISEGNAGRWEAASKAADAKAKRRKVLMDVSEYAALGASVVGIFLLVAFTLLNMAH